MVVRDSGRPQSARTRAYPASMHNHLDSGLVNQWLLVLGFPYVDVWRHTSCFGDVQDMEITNSYRRGRAKNAGDAQRGVQQGRAQSGTDQS